MSRCEMIVKPQFHRISTFRFRCLVMTESLDTKNIMSASPSEAESWTRDMDTGLKKLSGFLKLKELLFSAEYPCKLSPRSYPTWAAEKERQQKVSLTHIGYDVNMIQSSGDI